MNRKTRNKKKASKQSEDFGIGDLLQHQNKLLVIVIVWIAAVYSSSIQGVFIFDDVQFLQKEAFKNFFSFEWLSWAGRPVTNFTLALNLTLFGEQPWSFHLVNIAIHLVAVALVFYLTAQTLCLHSPETTSRATLIGLVTALLWGLHPLCTSAVTYIVQRSESLASMFMLLCLVCWLQGFRNGERVSRIPRWVWIVSAVLSCYFAYGSKQMSAGLPLIVLLYDRLFIAKSWSFLKARWYWYVAMVIPLFIGAWLVLPGLLQHSTRATAGFSLKGISSWEYFATQPYVLVYYLKLALVPYPQSLDYGWIPYRDLTFQLGGLFLWIMFFGIAVYLWRKSGAIAFCLTSGFLVLAPTSTFLAFQDIIFEHRMYFPVAFMVAIVAACFFGAKDRSDELASWKVLVVLVLAVVYSALTVNRNLDYSSAETIHSIDLTNNPENPRAWHSMGASLPGDQVESKIRHFRKAVELSQERNYFYAGTDYKWPRDLADVLFFTGQVREAKEIYESILDKSYNKLQKAEIYFQLAIIFSMEGDNSKAEEYFQLALKSPPELRKHVQAVYDEHLRRSGSSQPR